MIRLPPSSISLSETDVEFHLQQAEIYHGLLRQGFQRHDIIRYLTDHRRAISEAAGCTLEGELFPASSTVELAYRRPQNFSKDEELGECPQGSQSFPHESARASARNPERPSTDLATPPGENEDFDLRQFEGGSVSPVSAVPVMQVNKHAPRKSSLLRFATIASRESFPGDTEGGDRMPVLNVSPSGTVEYERSCAFREVHDASCVPEWPVEEMSQLSLTSTTAQRGSISELSDDMPFALPAPFSATPRMHPSLAVSPARPTVRQSFGNNFQGHSSSDSSQPVWTHRRNYTEGSIEDLPSSPPVFSASPVEELTHDDGPSTSSGPPATPTPVRRAAGFPRTEPRNHRHHYLDGNSFSVYNESLPSISQPQTPADLSRGPYITEHDAAYTAPPGRVRVGSAAASNVKRARWDLGVGEQSPTVRAIGLRERRNRELQRSVRVEGMRLRRMMVREETLPTQREMEAQRTGGGDAARAATRPRPRLFQPVLDDMWRDDLDADRVGEENFEGDTEHSRRGVMRVVSGNARFDGWGAGGDQ